MPLFVALTMFSIVTAHAQEPNPVFRASVDLIRLDVSVTDANGAPVTDLQRDDFELFQDGTRQRIQFAEFHREAPPRTTAPNPAGDLPSDRGAAPHVRRQIVFLVDDRQMDFDSVERTRLALSRFVDEELGSRDMAAIVGTHSVRSRNASLSLMSDHDALKRAIRQLRWERPRAGSGPQLEFAGEAPLNCSNAALADDVLDPNLTEGLLGAVETMVSQLRGVPGRKALLVLADRVNYGCTNYRYSWHERIRRLTDFAARSAVVIYGLHTLPFSSGVLMPEHRASASDVSGIPRTSRVPNEVSDDLRRLSEPTGGLARRSNDISLLIDGAVQDQGSYYVLAYAPPADTFSGRKLKYRKLTVRVRRPHVSVRTRGGFYNVADEAVVMRD